MQILEDEKEIINNIAKKTVSLKLSAIVILMLESTKPFNYIVSQLFVVLGPVVNVLFSVKDYNKITKMLEKRSVVEELITRVEYYTEYNKN